MIIDKILQAVTKENKAEKRSSPLRMSSSGKCARAIAYQLHGFPANPLPPRSIMVFRLGHTIEAEVKALIAKYCSDLDISYPAEAITYAIGDVLIEGHVDGLIGADTILEVKSINSMRFKMLDRMGIPDDYKKQANSYMKATGRTKTLFIFYCKDTSHLKEMTFHYDPDLMLEIYNRFLSVIASTKDHLPDREYQPLKSGQLPWQCRYCSYNQHCWPQAQLNFDKNNKPQLIIKEQNKDTGFLDVGNASPEFWKE